MKTEEKQMLELVRVFLGYCINCRKPTVVGEFKIAGWQHVFNLCDYCLGQQKDKLVSQMDMLTSSVIEQTPVALRER